MIDGLSEGVGASCLLPRSRVDTLVNEGQKHVTEPFQVLHGKA